MGVRNSSSWGIIFCRRVCISKKLESGEELGLNLHILIGDADIPSSVNRHAKWCLSLGSFFHSGCTGTPSGDAVGFTIHLYTRPKHLQPLTLLSAALPAFHSRFSACSRSLWFLKGQGCTSTQGPLHSVFPRPQQGSLLVKSSRMCYFPTRDSELFTDDSLLSHTHFPVPL